MTVHARQLWSEKETFSEFPAALNQSAAARYALAASPAHWFWIEGSEFRVSGFEFRVQGARFWVSGFGPKGLLTPPPLPGTNRRTPAPTFQAPALCGPAPIASRLPGWVSGFWGLELVLMVRDFGFRVQG